MSHAFLDASIPDLVQQLTTEEKIKLLSGPNWWNTNAIHRLGIPAVRMSDGPNVRFLPISPLTIIADHFLRYVGSSRLFSFCSNACPMSPSKTCKSLSFVQAHILNRISQCATSMASTFDTDSLFKVGSFLGEEAKIKSSVILLAPTCNIQRNPLGGRAFEYFSEDPHLSGWLSCASLESIISA